MSTLLATGTIICAEHNKRLDDEDLIEAIIAELAKPISGYKNTYVRNRADWDALSREEQISNQLAWVQPMPELS